MCFRFAGHSGGIINDSAVPGTKDSFTDIGADAKATRQGQLKMKNRRETSRSESNMANL
jgi:hypothetical protein